MSKACKQCGQLKLLDEFYPQPRNNDGRTGKCKECICRAVRTNYRQNREHYSQYDRERRQTLFRRAQCLQYQKARRKRNPVKYAARNAVANAIRDGRLVRKPCEVCGAAKVQAHHDDYAKPLDVRWLCFKHHREVAHGQVVTAA